jgi:hypothetical protein
MRKERQVGPLGKGKLDSKRKGHITESAIATRFLQHGYVVLTPFGGSERYDLVIEDADGQFWRIQCKTGWIENDAIYFDTANHNVTGMKRDWRHYQGQCDYFAVYCADSGRVYLIPVDQVGRTRAHLRIESAKNNQEKNVRWAKDYEL